MYRNSDYGGDRNSYGGFRSGRQENVNWGEKLGKIDWKKEKIPEVNWPKDQVSEKLEHRSASEIELWRKEHNISAFAEDVPNPILKFEETCFPKFVLDSFHRQGFTEPTAIQCQAWGIALLNRDMVGIAKTGSGKTLAFLCPAIMHIMAQAPLQYRDGPIVLVLAPTRELAKQIEDEAVKVLSGSRIHTVCAYGGTPKGLQLRQFDRGAHIAICCPGRLLDILAINGTNLKRVSFFVMDEADRMLDMGFEPQINSICSQLRPDRQTLMFSATWPKEIQSIANNFLKNYVRIHVGSTELLVNADVTQHFQVIHDSEKFDAMVKILHSRKNGKVIIFVATKADADILCHRLCHERFTAWAIHGNRTQQTRDACLAQFKASKEAILVATDVAQRGLDVRNLDTVINYDFPNTVEDYVHRVGRTGRAGAKGHSYTFLNMKHVRVIPELIQLLQRTNSPIPRDLLDLQAQDPRRGGFRGMGNRWGGRASFRGGGYNGMAQNYGASGGYYGSNNTQYGSQSSNYSYHGSGYGQSQYDSGYNYGGRSGYQNSGSSAANYAHQASDTRRLDDRSQSYRKRSRSRSPGTTVRRDTSRHRRDSTDARRNRSVSPKRGDRRRSISPKRSRG